MAKKRYFYNSKHKLTGYSSDKPPSFLKPIALAILILIGGSLLQRANGNKKPANNPETHIQNTGTKSVPDALEQRDASPITAEGTRRQSVEVSTNTLETQTAVILSPGTSSSAVPVESQSGFDRDLRPGYTRDCEAGDESACFVLRREDRLQARQNGDSLPAQNAPIQEGELEQAG